MIKKNQTTRHGLMDSPVGYREGTKGSRFDIVPFHHHSHEVSPVPGYVCGRTDAGHNRCQKAMLGESRLVMMGGLKEMG